MADERPTKRVKLLSNGESSGSDSETSGGGVHLDIGSHQEAKTSLKVNEEFAKRFEHNKKRAELHRLEEKYGNGGAGNNRAAAEDSDVDDNESSTDEEEDEDAELAAGALDEQFQAALNALRKKDPSIYKKDVKFYDDEDEKDDDGKVKPKDKSKPMYLSDYHRQNLLSGQIGSEEEEHPKPTYAQEQEALKRDVVQGFHADESSSDNHDNDEEADGDGFLVKKRIETPDPSSTTITNTALPTTRPSAKDDPEAFLDDFLSRRAWLPAPGANTTHAFESDDEDFDQRADDFEQAYNLRFEDPDANKGKLVSHARDVAARYSVRQEPVNARQRVREQERTKKEALKKERDEDKARLRRLKMEEAEEKLKMVKKAAGLRGKVFSVDEWAGFLTEDWDDERWQKEFEKRFGDDYYAEEDAVSGDDEGEVERKRKKAKKPKFDDDIDITDLVPEFENEEATFSITEDEGEEADVDGSSVKKPKKSKDHKKEKEDAKREARKERRKIEALVAEKMNLDEALIGASGAGRKGKTPVVAPFRYRETSPTAFGLTANEILMASDSQLNEFVGLKKLATFRDEVRKRKDKKHLGKKARLRKWRKDTFGNESGPMKTLQDVLREGENTR